MPAIFLYVCVICVCNTSLSGQTFSILFYRKKKIDVELKRRKGNNLCTCMRGNIYNSAITECGHCGKILDRGLDRHYYEVRIHKRPEV